jgi:hypothetical protein
MSANGAPNEVLVLRVGSKIVRASRHGCETCGRGTDTITLEDGESGMCVLRGIYAELIWRLMQHDEWKDRKR